MVYVVRARDGASRLNLRRATRETAEMTAEILREQGYTDVEVLLRPKYPKSSFHEFALQ